MRRGRRIAGSTDAAAAVAEFPDAVASPDRTDFAVLQTSSATSAALPARECREWIVPDRTQSVVRQRGSGDVAAALGLSCLWTPALDRTQPAAPQTDWLVESGPVELEIVPQPAPDRKPALQR